MTQGERVKKIRKEYELTLEEFGKRLGVTKVAISNIENGNRNLTSQMIVSICREFNVNENWLCNEEGNMLIAFTRNEIISKFAGGLIRESADSFKKQLVEVLAELNESEWEVLEGIARKLAKKD